MGRAAGEGRSGASFLREHPSGREALPRLRLSKGCLSWHVQTSQTDVIVPSFSPHLSVKPICLTYCLGPEVQIQSLRVLHRGLRQGHGRLFILREDLLKIEPQLAFVNQRDHRVKHGLQNNHMALREVSEGRSFGQHSLESYIDICKTQARSSQSQGKQLLGCGRK